MKINPDEYRVREDEAVDRPRSPQQVQHRGRSGVAVN